MSNKNIKNENDNSGDNNIAEEEPNIDTLKNVLIKAVRSLKEEIYQKEELQYKNNNLSKKINTMSINNKKIYYFLKINTIFTLILFCLFIFYILYFKCEGEFLMNLRGSFL